MPSDWVGLGLASNKSRNKLLNNLQCLVFTENLEPQPCHIDFTIG